MPRKTLILMLVVAMAAQIAGCLPGQARPEPSPEQIRAAVREEMRSRETERLIEDEVQRIQVRLTLAEVLETPEGQIALQDQLEEMMDTPDFKKALETRVAEVMAMPEVRKAIQEAVRWALMDMIRQGQGGGGGGS